MGSTNSTENHQNLSFSSSNQSETIETRTDSSISSKSKFKLTRLTLPTKISHIKTGNTLATNNHLLILQDGATTIDFRLPPEFKPQKIPWKFGLLRDIIWSEDLRLFLLLTKTALYTIDPNLFFVTQGPKKTTENETTINNFAQVKPYQSTAAFWRCTTFDNTLLIINAGFGTVMDQYKITRNSCDFIKRWTSPSTCEYFEGIWCIRHHPETKQIGCAILDARTNHWRFEFLPFENGDCEVSSLINGQWLATNSFNIRLIQIAQERLESAVEYERELKNALVIDQTYLVIRTKSTIEVHRLDLIK